MIQPEEITFNFRVHNIPKNKISNKMLTKKNNKSHSIPNKTRNLFSTNAFRTPEVLLADIIKN